MKREYNIIGNRKKFFIFSGCLIAFIFIYALIFGVPMDIQFKGGAMITYGYQGEISEKAVTGTVASVLGADATLQTGNSLAGDTKTIIINLPGTTTVETATVAELHDILAKTYADNNFEQLEITNVNATLGKEFFAKSLVAVLVASLLILLYIAFRFRKIGGWPAGSMAVAALVHDMIVIFGVFVIFRIPLNGNFIAATLTILGYSINDTVVIYDRIRENGELYGKSVPFETLVNKGINQSLRRSINSTVSTVIALGTVCVVSMFFGLDSIFTFAFPLIIGMVSGVYSTICIATPLWVEWESRHAEKVTKKTDKKAKA